jgi:uncharacterized protein
MAQAYTPDSRRRSRTEFLTGREAIIQFLKRKWANELDYHLMKELWCYSGNRISIRFEYEWRDAANPSQWMRTHGNEHWEFDENGLMRIRDMSANDYAIQESDVAIANLLRNILTDAFRVMITLTEEMMSLLVDVG